MYTISRLAKQFGLSRSTLLYYDSIQLFASSKRSDSGYRMYTQEDFQRLEKICHYRKTGLSLREIKSLIASDSSKVGELLENRLQQLNGEINGLRDQQMLIVRILKKANLIKKSRIMTKEKWSQMLRAAGLDNAAMKRWHVEFERTSPEGHQDFLESLRLTRREILHIRRWSDQSR